MLKMDKDVKILICNLKKQGWKFLSLHKNGVKNQDVNEFAYRCHNKLPPIH